MATSRRIQWLALVGLVSICLAVFLIIIIDRLNPVTERTTIRPPTIDWVYESPRPGGIIATPNFVEDRLLVGVIHDAVGKGLGELVCLDANGKPLWSFDRDGSMLHMYSSPQVADGRIYIGEGMHANLSCRLFCLDAGNGRFNWEHAVAGHIESTACLSPGRVIVGAGDDGLVAVVDITGKRQWQYNGNFHIDSQPVVVGNLVVASAGVSRRFRESAVVGVDLATGVERWRIPTELPAWGSPAVVDEQIIVGLGAGRLDQAGDRPGGAILAIDFNGRRRWQRDLPDAVLARAAVANGRIVVGSRDGVLRCLDASDGRVIWTQNLGSPILNTPAVQLDQLITAPRDGPVFGISAATGDIEWIFDPRELNRGIPRILASPVTTGNRVFVAVEFRGPAGPVAAVIALRH